MIQLRLLPGLASSAVLLLAILGPRAAWALDECQTSDDCDKGLACTVVSTGACPGAPACAPGADCPAPAPCQITEEKACTPAPCMSDLECGDGMVCHASDVGCASAGCACSSDQPDCGCVALPPPDCAAASVSYCTPKYVLPCQTADDCGMGFDCVQETITTCSGGGGAEPTPQPAPSPPADADLPAGSGGSSGSGFAKPGAPVPEPIDPSCTTEPAGYSHCVAKELTCDATSDCPAGWLCEQQSYPTDPGCAGEGCSMPAPPPEPLPPAQRLCRPEYGGGVLAQDGSVGTPTAPGAGPVPVPEKGENSGNGDNDGSHESTACQMGHAPASTGALSLLTVLGALVGLKRRRR
ncbi:MAG TPA: hypothetical protein VIW29_16630 [Polyangiaceae bacterium]